MKLASAVVKLMAATELLLKEELERICPALVLDKVDDDGLQVAKAFGLAKELINPKQLESVELKTAPFPKLLNRATKFMDLKEVRPSLEKLYKIRNALLHHRCDLDVLEVNLLLTKEVLPLLESLTHDNKKYKFRIGPKRWERLKEIEQASKNLFESDLAKKLAHHAELASKLSAMRIALLTKSPPELTSRDEEVVEQNLKCPACKNDALAAFHLYDVDYDDESGLASGGYRVVSMRCCVCALDLDESEIEYIVENFDKYLGEEAPGEDKYWGQTLEPDYPEY